MIARKIPCVDADRKHGDEVRDGRPKSPHVFDVFRRRRTPYDMELPVYGNHHGAFAQLRNSRVLIYWPHGFGDFVHLSYIVPLLEPSNQYFLTRFGDDFVHLYDEGEIVTPIYAGTRTIGNGTNIGARAHLGLDVDRIRNRAHRLHVPEPLRSRMGDARIDAILYSQYPEMAGRTPYPFHTKARFELSKLITPERLRQFDLSKPLRSSLAFRAPQTVAAEVEARLRGIVVPGERLYLLSAGGHTQLRKTLPEHEILTFARELRRRDPAARLLTVDERTTEQTGREPGLAPTLADYFADVPFAHVIVTLIRASFAFVGVGSGPLHAAMSIGGRPIVGVWLRQWPEYYDEPQPDAWHLVGPEVVAEGQDQRIGGTTRAAAGVLEHRMTVLADRVPGADDILDTLDVLTRRP